MHVQAELRRGGTQFYQCVLLVFSVGIPAHIAISSLIPWARMKASLLIVCPPKNESLWVLTHSMQMGTQVEVSVSRSGLVHDSQMLLCPNH